MAREEQENVEENEQEADEQELERHIRMSKAIEWMQMELQLSSAVVMPILLKLIKAYDGKWEHIEADGYRLLADVIFQNQEAVEKEKAPGSSSGKKVEKKEKKGVAIRTKPSKRKPRYPKSGESDYDSDENEYSQELVRRNRHTVSRASNFQSGGGQRSPGQPVRESFAVDKQTQTEAVSLKEISEASKAITCFEEITEADKLYRTPVVKQEQDDEILLTLPAPEVCKEINNQSASNVVAKKPDENWNTSEKPRPRLGPRFDPSKVKSEAQESVQRTAKTAEAESAKEPPYLVPLTSTLECLNPKPLQSVVPTSHLPLALPSIEIPMVGFETLDTENMEFQTPEPICSTKAEVEGAKPVVQMQMAQPYTVNTAIEGSEPVETTTCSSLEVKEEPDMVPVNEDIQLLKGDSLENSVMMVEDELVVSSKAGPENLTNTSLTKNELIEGVLRDCENPTTESVVLKLATNMKESDNLAGDTSVKLEAGSADDRVADTSPRPREGVEQKEGSHGGADGSDLSPTAAIDDASSEVEKLPETLRESGTNRANAETKQDEHLPTPVKEESSIGAGEVTETNKHSSEAINLNVKPMDSSQSKSEVKERTQSSGGTSSGLSGSSKKRKRTLIKKHQLELAENPPNEAEKLCYRHRQDYSDISRGKEKVPISLSASCSEDLPKEFFYTKISVVFQSAHVGISMARIGEDDRCSSCVGNCLDRSTPCECARLTDGEFAYTVEGLLYPHFLKQELERKSNLSLLSFCQPGVCPIERTGDVSCKGHIQRRFIKECWEKCGCTQLCGNRIVQRGITQRLQVFWTGGKGWGVQTLEHLPAGTFVCEYIGEILTNTEMWHRNNDCHRAAKHHFSLQLDADWCSERFLKDEEALCLDGTCYGNVARFINHRCVDNNLLEIPVEIESPDHHYYHLAFFTSKDVKANEELTWDYELDFNDKEHPLQAFECLCGSTFCRGKNLEEKP